MFSMPPLAAHLGAAANSAVAHKLGSRFSMTPLGAVAILIFVLFVLAALVGVAYAIIVMIRRKNQA